MALPILRTLRKLCDTHVADYKIFQNLTTLKTAAAGVKEYNIALSEAAPTLILKSESEMLAAIVRADRKVSFKKLKKLLNVKKIRLASPEEVKALTGAEVGYVSLINKELRSIIDNSLFKNEYIYGGCGVQNYTLRIKTSDLAAITHAAVLDFTESRIDIDKRS